MTTATRTPIADLLRTVGGADNPENAGKKSLEWLPGRQVITSAALCRTSFEEIDGAAPSGDWSVIRPYSLTDFAQAADYHLERFFYSAMEALADLAGGVLTSDTLFIDASTLANYVDRSGNIVVPYETNQVLFRFALMRKARE